MQDLKISLIIPAYNEEKYIGNCLDHIFKNSHGKIFEIIVVDNNSSDKTAEIVKRYKNVKLITEIKKGVTRARQKGYKESSGDILAYIDADNLIPPGWIETIMYEFKKDKKLASLSGPYRYYDTSIFINLLIKIYWRIAMLAYFTIGYMAIGGNFTIRREILEKINGFDTSINFYGDDTDTVRRAHKFGKTKFKFNFFLYSSARRFKGQGFLNTASKYILNFLSQVFFHKIVTKTYQDIR